MERTENDERGAPTSKLTEAGSHTSLNQARSDLEALINSSPVGVLVVDAETRVVLSVNCEAERITGVPYEPGITLDQYREAMNYRRPCGNEGATEEFPLERALAQGETVRAQFIFHHAGGEAVTALINAAPNHSQDGRILSAAAVIQDITPLEELKRLRSESLSMMSQELRLPLTAIKGSTAMALGSPSPPDPAETRHLFQIIDGQVNLLRSLINNFLDMTQAETGAPSFTSEWARGKEREPVPGFEDPHHLLPPETPPPYRLKDLTIDYDERSVTAAGRHVQLTATEYKLIFELSVNAGRVLTHRQLVDRVWGSDHTGDTQILRAFVKDIRKKLGDDARNPTYIFTLPRVGYRMAKPA